MARRWIASIEADIENKTYIDYSEAETTTLNDLLERYETDILQSKKGKNVEKEGQAGVVESTKAASDIYSPIAGEVTEVNQSIVDDPAAVNKDPEGNAWFFKIKVKNKSDIDTLMSKADYEKFAKENPN